MTYGSTDKWKSTYTCKTGAAEENISRVSLTVKKTYQRLSTECSGRKILLAIGTVDMTIGQCLRINSTEYSTPLTELKMDTNIVTCIWTKNKIFNEVYTVCPTRYRTRHFLIILPLMRILKRLQIHSSSFLTQQTYSCSNFFAISSLVLEL